MRKTALAAFLLAEWAGAASADGFSYLNVGIDYFNQQRYANAVTWLDKAIAAGDLNPDQMHVAYLDRGQSHAQLNRPEDAVADFTAALDLRPNDLTAQLERSFAYVAAGQPEKAAADTEAAAVSASKVPWVILYRGLVAWELGHYQAADGAFSDLADKGYAGGWLWLQLANVKQNKTVTKFAGIKSADGTVVVSGVPYFWPGPVMSFFAGSKSEADVLRAMGRDMTEKRSAFFAYPSASVDIGQSINKAIATFNTYGNCQIEGWEQNDISGLPLVAPIFSKISDAAFLAADITYLNENVAFEIG